LYSQLASHSVIGSGLPAACDNTRYSRFGSGAQNDVLGLTVPTSDVCLHILLHLNSGRPFHVRCFLLRIVLGGLCQYSESLRRFEARNLFIFDPCLDYRPWIFTSLHRRRVSHFELRSFDHIVRPPVSLRSGLYASEEMVCKDGSWCIIVLLPLKSLVQDEWMGQMPAHI